MDLLIRKASSFIGVPHDLLRIALCIVASFPLSSLVKRIPLSNSALKDATIAAIGVFYLAGVFNLYYGVLQLLFLSLISYFLALLWPNKKWMPWANFIIQMGLMLFTHCKEQFAGGDYVNEIGISGSQMILVQKLTCYNWDIYDGTRPEAELNEHQQSAKITGSPSVLRYISWVFFFPTILTGPACTFTEYSNWADMSMFNSLPNKKGTLPRSGAVVLGLKILEGLFWVVVYTQSTSISGNLDFVYSNWYKALPFTGRAIYIYLIGLAFRTKYYAAWTLSEAACIHSGLGFNGVNPSTGKLRWDRMRNVQPLGVEAGQNIRGILGSWNIITSKWLRFYVYERVTPKNQKPGTKSTFITFLVSALWHGTRPGYYLTFITAATYQTFGKLYRKLLRPVFVDTPYKKVYDVFTLIASQLALGFAAIPFILLDFTPAIAAWKSVYFYLYVVFFVSWVLLLGPGRPFIVPRIRMLHRDIKKTE